MATTIMALSDAQQVFNQRLLSEHCLDEAAAKRLWHEIVQDYNHDDYEDNHHHHLSLAEALRQSNAQLQMQLGLEIVALSIDNTRYYTIINKNPHDEVNKTVLQNAFFPMTTGAGGGAASPEALQDFLKRLLQTIVDHDDDGQPAITRANAINLRNDGDKDKNVPLHDAQALVDRLVDEKWLVVIPTKNGGSHNGGSSSDTAKKQQRNHSYSNHSLLTFGARIYAELSYLLVEEFGLDESKVPQQIFL
jgi:hypothetical protein